MQAELANDVLRRSQLVMANAASAGAVTVANSTPVVNATPAFFSMSEMLLELQGDAQGGAQGDAQGGAQGDAQGGAQREALGGVQGGGEKAVL